MVWLPGIGKGRGGHGNLYLAEHVIKPAHPLHPDLFLFLHGQVQRNPKVHFLGCLQSMALTVLYHITLQQEVQPRVGEQAVALLTDESLSLFNLLPAVILKDIRPVKPLVRQVFKLIIQGDDTQGPKTLLNFLLELAIPEPGRCKFPSGRLPGGQLCRGPDKGLHVFLRSHIRFFKCPAALK